MTNYAPNSATEAVARARRSSVWRPKGMCLNYVWDALTSQVKSYGLRNAHAGWERTTLRRFDRTPPAGAPVYWTGYEHGHVALSVGGGKVRSTDNPTNEQVSEVTLAQIERRWPGLTYAGYGLDFAGDPIRGLATIPTEQETPEVITDADVQKIAAATREAILWAPTIPGADPKSLAASSVRNNLGMIGYYAQNTSAVVASLAAKAGVDVDEAAIAAQVASLVGPELVETLRPAVTEAVTEALTGADPTAEEVAAAVVDRLASALAAPPAA